MRDKPRTVCLAFETMYESLDKGKRLGIVGSVEELGSWKFERCALATESPPGSGRWIAVINLPPMETIEWKWVVVNRNRTRVFRWEERANRMQSTGVSNGRIIAPWNNTSTFSVNAETSRIYVTNSSTKYDAQYIDSEVSMGSSFMDRIRAGPSFIDRLREAPSLLDRIREAPSLMDRIRGAPSLMDRIRGAPSLMDSIRGAPSIIDRFRDSRCVIL